MKIKLMALRFTLPALLIGLWLQPGVARSQTLQRGPQPNLSDYDGSLTVASELDFPRFRLFPCPSVPVSDSSNAEEMSGKSSRGSRPRGLEIHSFESSACANVGTSRYFIVRNIPFDGKQIARMQMESGRPSLRSLQNPADLDGGLLFEAERKPSETSESANESIHWWSLLEQSFNFLVLEHSFRVATDPFLRYLLWHKPFWHDWAASNQHFYLNQWGDGDDFIVNYIGHPMEGGVTGNIFIVNDPKGRSLQFGRSRAYWMSRLRAMAYAAVYSAQFEAGPILSESAIGNEGGYFYKPGCDPHLTCSTPGKKPITNNTGWVDFVITPTVGMGWIVLEDAIETEVVDRLAKSDDGLGWKILRGSLTPTHVMANFVAGKTPWYRYRTDGPDGGSLFDWHKTGPSPKFSFENMKHWEFGVHYTYLRLPVDTEACANCRVENSGVGANFAYRITNRLWVDSDINYLPGSGNYRNKGSMAEGLFGPRYGYTGKSWGLYFKLRPGFIYYDKTLTADSGVGFTNATRFAFDVGSIFEWYTSPHAVIRFDAGTTVVRYLTGRDDPRQPPGNILSTDYIVSQSNFQISTGYTYRF